MPDAFYQLWFAVRYVHVASIALLAGGALLAAVATVTPSLAGASMRALHVAYEWTFWTVVGVTTVTGVSNLGLKGAGLLGPVTGWGRALTTKVVAVLVLLCLSRVRTDVVRRIGNLVAGEHQRARRVLASLYALTGAALLGAMWIGMGLAHGRY